MTNKPDLLTLKGSVGIKYFYYLLTQVGLGDTKAYEIAQTAAQTNAFLADGGKKGIKAAKSLIDLEARWYNSVRKKDKPDYDCYSEDIYLAEVWCCWDFYARKYINDLKNNRNVPPFGFKKLIKDYTNIVDLGNGVGMSTAALKQTFPKNIVYGTNLPDTTQWKFNKLLSEEYDYKLIDDLKKLPRDIEFVFASEYFEHFPDPINHLTDVLTYCNPKILVCANAFKPDSIGHFDNYSHGSEVLTPKEISREFTKFLKDNGYIKLKTKLWNQRPTIYLRGGLHLL